MANEDPKVIVSGGGVAGLLLALSLKKMDLDVQVFEQAPEYTQGAGGAVGLYPNGLRIIRDISPELLLEINRQGRPYKFRKWMRHDGHVIAVGKERHLTAFESKQDELELSSLGIRRYRLQSALHDACTKVGIKINLGKRINSIKVINGQTECILSDGKTVQTDLLFGCDGVNSVIRNNLFGESVIPKYTGITCLMGSAPIAKTSPINGICFPSSTTTNAHACFYPCSSEEIIFQIFTPCPENPESWKTLSKEEAKKECTELYEQLSKDGWGKIFTDPIKAADSVLRVGLRAREPIPVWHSPAKDPKIFLLGDAAHPPVPYIGQGAMMYYLIK
jgi:salicylate hydroxylase